MVSATPNDFLNSLLACCCAVNAIFYINFFLFYYLIILFNFYYTNAVALKLVIVIDEPWARPTLTIILPL